MSTSWQDKTSAELHQAAIERREAARAARFAATGSKSTNVKAVKVLRRELAQILTALRQKTN